MLVSEYLIVGARCEIVVRQRPTRVDDITKIVFPVLFVTGSMHYPRTYVKKAAYSRLYDAVVVDEELILLFVKRPQIVRVIFEKRAHVICRYESVPMEVPPVTVIGDANVARRNFQC